MDFHLTAEQQALRQRARDLADGTFAGRADRKSTRLNSSHSQISYAVFCLKKKNKSNQSYAVTYDKRMISVMLHITTPSAILLGSYIGLHTHTTTSEFMRPTHAGPVSTDTQ